jgi:hypothetical protein
VGMDKAIVGLPAFSYDEHDQDRCEPDVYCHRMRRASLPRITPAWVKPVVVDRRDRGCVRPIAGESPTNHDDKNYLKDEERIRRLIPLVDQMAAPPEWGARRDEWGARRDEWGTRRDEWASRWCTQFIGDPCLPPDYRAHRKV